MGNERATTIVLCGGRINYTNLPIGTNLSNAMIPVSGKPVIGWILDDLIAKDIRRDVRVVLRAQDRRLRSFLQRAYRDRLDLHLVPLRESGTIVESLGAGIARDPLGGTVRVVLGDTLIRDAYEGQDDFVYTGRVRSSRRWCLAVTGAQGRVLGYHDKEELPDGTYQALAGYYHFRHGDCLRACVRSATERGERELSDVLRRYGSRYPIYARQAETWHDFGNIDNLITARRELLRPRYFNSLRINPILNTITKVSERDRALQDELDWYLSLPRELSVLTPRILNHRRVDGRLQVVQEYYGYPTLAELYVFSELHADTWLSILRHLLDIHREFSRYSGELEPEQIAGMYAGKTWSRLDTLASRQPAWGRLLTAPLVAFNGRQLQGLPSLRSRIDRWSQKLSRNGSVCIVHGDFCFSNILHDINNQIIRLIDPRGRFGVKGIYGDSRYDIAKLRHSVCGFYDFLVTDMFEISGHGVEFKGRIFTDETHRTVARAFDRLVAEAGYGLDEIKFIEGLLFVSMLPLHQDSPQRQRMMFLTGLSLLNEVLACES